MKEEILKKLFEYVTSLECIVKEQVPDVLNQILIRGYISNIILILFSIVVFINLFISIKVFKKIKTQNVYDDNILPGVYLFLSGLIAVVAMVAIFYGIENILTIYFVPKIYLLQYLKG